jgi:hypothetical protein
MGNWYIIQITSYNLLLFTQLGNFLKDCKSFGDSSLFPKFLEAQIVQTNLGMCIYTLSNLYYFLHIYIFFAKLCGVGFLILEMCNIVVDTYHRSWKIILVNVFFGENLPKRNTKIRK